MQLTSDRSDTAPNERSHETVHRFRIQSADVGTDGVVDGGTLLEWIDMAAHATAVQWCSGNCVAASIGNVHLHRPLRVGDVIEVRATLVYTGHSSMHFLITVSSGTQTAQCATIFVAFDSFGELMGVPQWVPLSMLELQRHRQARARKRMRQRIQDAMEAETYPGSAFSVTLRFRGGPTDVTVDGKVRGGRVMRWMDEAAFACGAEWTGGDVLTSYVTGICLYEPVFVGDVVDVTASVIHTGPRSVHLSVRVMTAESLLVAHGVVVVVSPGAHGDAQPVPQRQLVSDEDQRLDRHARHLIALREYLEPFSAAPGGRCNTERSAIPPRPPATPA